MKFSEIRKLSIIELATYVRNGETSPCEIVRTLLEQIRRTDDRLKAYVTICEDSALQLAHTAEVQLRAGRDLGPLHGIPISIKDIFETQGIRTTCGSKLLHDYVPTEDCTVVKRLRSAGAIILGKLSTFEFAAAGGYPPTRNPWDITRTTGGSSSGSGASVAACSAIAATGSDTGGSIRSPASFCGVVGLKPTYGRVSRAGVFPESWSLDHVGPITRCVEDAALLLSIMAGHDDLDPTSSELPVPDYVGQLKNDISGVRVGVPKNHFFDRCDKEVNNAVNCAIEVLSELGCRVIDFEFPHIREINAAFEIIESCELGAFHQRSIEARARDYQPDTRLMIERGLFIPATHYIKALRTRAMISAKIMKFFREFDIILTPTTPIVAYEANQEKVRINGVEESVGSTRCRYLLPFNLIGIPALSLPCGFSNNGLPIGMQIAGKAFDESTVLRVGHAYERATAWHSQFPDIA